LILVPALMQLAGDWNWWMPRWLDRILPRLSFEGHHTEVAPAPVAGASE
jgi:RND superfamily putative drug exporter